MTYTVQPSYDIVVTLSLDTNWIKTSIAKETGFGCC